MIHEVEQILLQLELLLRGGAQSVHINVINELNVLSRKVLLWFSASDAGAVYTADNDNHRTEVLALAVKLHNKVRNLTTSACGEIKTNLKAAAAWMLCLYGGKNAKVLSVAVNVLSKSGRELEHYGSDSDLVLRCLSGSMLYWMHVGSLSIHKDFSPVELQDMKLSALWAGVEKAKILWRIGGSPEDIRKAVAFAGDIVQSLPSRIKTSFAQEAISIADKMSQVITLADDAIHLFKTALNAIESAMIPSVCDDVDCGGDIDKSPLAAAADTNRMKLNVLLALAFLYMTARDTAKALSCVASIEQLAQPTAESVAHTILYAKYCIFLRDKDQQAAEGALWALLKLALTPFAMALNAVKALSTEALSGQVDAVPFYKYLAGKYPNEPEHTVIRINHLQIIVANVCTSGDDGGMVTTKALDITNSIVQAHIKREKVLSGEHYGSIKHLISERIRWHRTQAEWEPTIGWCDTLVALLSDSLDEKEGAVAVLVLKVDAFIRQGRYPDAVKLSAETFAMLPNTRTILMRFKALVHADSPQVAVDAFQEMHRSLLDTSNTVTAASVANPYLSSTAEYLSRIVLCCGVLKDSPALNDVKRDKITELMVREWVQRYGAEHMWEEAGEYKDSDSMLIDTTPTAAPVCTYFGMVCDYMHMYLAHVMELRPATTAQDSNKMEVISVEAAVRCFVTDGGEERRGGDSEFTAASIASSLSAPVVGASQATDFFTFYGYPDSLNAAAASAEGCEFIFSCPLNVLRKDVLVLLEDMISTIAALERSDQPITVLGNAQDLTWLKRLANNLAVVLLRRSGQVYKNSDTPLRLVTAARFFEISQFLGSKQVAGCASGGGYGESGSESATDLAAALINASACRIDAEPSVPSQQSSSSRHELTLSSVTQSGVDVMLQPGTSGSSHPAETASAPLTSGIPSNNLAQARMDVQEADRLLQALSDFDDPRAKRLQNMALVIEFAAVCKAGNQRQCEGFLRERHNAFLRQSASELRRCAHVAREEVSMEAARSLMNLALQICVRDSGGSPDYRLMGALYAELIDTSPSRKHALQKVEEFEQLASNLTAPPSSASVAEPSDAVNTFAPDDVDNIVSRAYNNGVSLVDLDQLEMAETFVCKAISLLNLASPSLKGWLPKMQETYSSLLKAKSKGAGAHAFCPPTVAGGGTTNRPATADRDKTGAVVAGADVETDQQEVGKKRAASTATAPPPRVKEPTLQLEHVK